VLPGFAVQVKQARQPGNHNAEFVRPGRVESLVDEKLTLAGAFTRQAQRQLRNGMRDRANASARTARGALREARDVIAILSEEGYGVRERIAAGDRELRLVEVELIGDYCC